MIPYSLYLPEGKSSLCPSQVFPFRFCHTDIASNSGTITPILTYIIYHLALSPSHVANIRDELKTAEDIRSDQNLQKLPYLNAFINETLRVHPPILDGLPRNTPAGGIMVNDTHIPGNVTCLAPFCIISKRKFSLYPKRE